LEKDRASDLILEHAVLNVKAGEEEAFAQAMNAALPLISASEGFISIEVLSCVENASQFLLLVKWRSVEDHEIGFRGSARYQQWKSLLHKFYEPFPVVQHYGAAIAQYSHDGSGMGATAS
jgi:heme-degrading monooxygenase HmoA